MKSIELMDKAMKIANGEEYGDNPEGARSPFILSILNNLPKTVHESA